MWMGFWSLFFAVLIRLRLYRVPHRFVSCSVCVPYSNFSSSYAPTSFVRLSISSSCSSSFCFLFIALLWLCFIVLLLVFLLYPLLDSRVRRESRKRKHFRQECLEPVTIRLMYTKTTNNKSSVSKKKLLTQWRKHTFGKVTSSAVALQKCTYSLKRYEWPLKRRVGLTFIVRWALELVSPLINGVARGRTLLEHDMSVL